MWTGPRPGIATTSRQALRRDGAQAVRRDADNGVVKAGDGLARAFEQAQIALDIADEPPLPLDGRRAAEAALAVEDGQQRQPDAGLRAAAAMRRASSAGSA